MYKNHVVDMILNDIFRSNHKNDENENNAAEKTIHRSAFVMTKMYVDIARTVMSNSLESFDCIVFELIIFSKMRLTDYTGSR